MIKIKNKQKEKKKKEVSLRNKYTFIGSLGRKLKCETGNLYTALQVCSVWLDVDHKLHHSHSEHM